jgi:hypothetical protein
MDMPDDGKGNGEAGATPLSLPYYTTARFTVMTPEIVVAFLKINAR